MHQTAEEYRRRMNACIARADLAYSEMAKIQMIDNRLERYFEAVYPRSAAQNKKADEPQRWGFLREIFEGQADLQTTGVRGTLWTP